MLLPFTDSLVVTTHFDPECAALADRHYSRRTVGARQFLYSGRKIVIRDTEGLLVFGWLWCDEDKRMDGQTGYNCAIFRNESARISSEVILECERIAVERWGPNRGFTYVNPSAIRSSNPGYCFKRAGWRFLRTSANGKLHLLAKEELAVPN
ncbi:MAG TPA: hypothetical protein VKV74_01830 [Bryobacteraceae bacterium]|nr:hypothetical protein [Bryobacteraceae bacterium]